MKYTRPTFRFLSLLAATFLWVAPSWGQSAYVSGAPSLSASSTVNSAAENTSTDDPQAIVTLHARVSEVNVLFIATDKHGKFVRNLTQSDFSYLDDHKPPQAILNFRRETDLPLQLGLLVDTSGSVHSRFDFEQQAAVGFLQHVLRPNFDKAFVMGFSTHNQVTQDFTDNVHL